MYKLCPFHRTFALVERLPGDGFSDGDVECLADVLIHLVDQIEHGEVEGQKAVGEIRQTIEGVGILTAEVDRNDVALIFHALGDKRLLPREVANLAIPSARTQACREHQQMIVALEAGFHNLGEGTGALRRRGRRSTSAGDSIR